MRPDKLIAPSESSSYAEQPIDLRALSESYPALRPYIREPRGKAGPAFLQWDSYDGNRELTRALLHRDFGVDWWIPDGHLCPPVPNRLNYLLWLRDLLRASGEATPAPPAAPPDLPQPANGEQQQGRQRVYWEQQQPQQQQQQQSEGRHPPNVIEEASIPPPGSAAEGPASGREGEAMAAGPLAPPAAADAHIGGSSADAAVPLPDPSRASSAACSAACAGEREREREPPASGGSHPAPAGGDACSRAAQSPCPLVTGSLMPGNGAAPALPSAPLAAAEDGAGFKAAGGPGSAEGTSPPLPLPPTAPLVRVLDVGTGANLIYPLLGAALLGWAFVGTDISREALAAAAANRARNPHLAPLIELRSAAGQGGCRGRQDSGMPGQRHEAGGPAAGTGVRDAVERLGGAEAEGEGQGGHCQAVEAALRGSDGAEGREGVLGRHDGGAEQGQAEGPVGRGEEGAGGQQEEEGYKKCEVAAGSQAEGADAVLLGVVRPGESFSCCMSNPPFFERGEQAGANPRTAFGGSAGEMVCAGGELAFIRRMVADSRALRGAVRWYTSMVGRKATLRVLLQELRGCPGVTAVTSTEFKQGRTSRWGLAWSFHPQAAASLRLHAPAPPSLPMVAGYPPSQPPAATDAPLLSASADACALGGVEGLSASTAAATAATAAAGVCPPQPSFPPLKRPRLPGALDRRSRLQQQQQQQQQSSSAAAAASAGGSSRRPSGPTKATIFVQGLPGRSAAASLLSRLRAELQAAGAEVTAARDADFWLQVALPPASPGAAPGALCQLQVSQQAPGSAVISAALSSPASAAPGAEHPLLVPSGQPSVRSRH